MKTDLEQMAEQLPGWDKTSKQPPSNKGQRSLFENGLGLSRKVKQSLEQGQTLLWEQTKEANP